MIDVPGIQEAIDGDDARYDRAHQDRSTTKRPAQRSTVHERSRKAAAEGERGEGVAGVVDEVGEQRDLPVPA